MRSQAIWFGSALILEAVRQTKLFRPGGNGLWYSVRLITPTNPTPVLGMFLHPEPHFQVVSYIEGHWFHAEVQEIVPAPVRWSPINFPSLPR